MTDFVTPELKQGYRKCLLPGCQRRANQCQPNCTFCSTFLPHPSPLSIFYGYHLTGHFCRICLSTQTVQTMEKLLDEAYCL